MTGLPTAFFEADPRDPSRFIATALTRGPWDNRAQHGGPPAALLARALAAHENPEVDEPIRFEVDGAPDVVHPLRRHPIARLAFELHRPVPLAPLKVQVSADRLGRSVHRLDARLTTDDGTLIVTARAIRIQRTASPASTVPIDAWPLPDHCAPLVFSFFRHEVGYHRAIELRTAHGRWGRTPIGVWGRLAVPVVEGEPLTALETIVALSDAQSGMGVPLDPQQFTFVNPDLTILLTRDPIPGWVGFDITSTAGARGSGLAQSSLRDSGGLLGRAAQSLVVARRFPG